MIGTKKKTKRQNVFKEIAESFDHLTQHPERFLKPQPEKIDAIQQLIQQTYTISISGDVENKSELLPELVLEDMDEEQIWQQLEMRNELLLQQLIKQTAQFSAMREQHLGIELDDDEDDEEEEPEKEDPEELEKEEEDIDSDDLPSDREEPKKTKSKTTKPMKSKSFRKSVVDDTFFKLDEMKAFLEQEDAKEMRKHKNKQRNEDEGDLIDYYADDFGLGVEDDDQDDDDEVNANYADFFDMDEELEQIKLQNSSRVSKQKDFFNEQSSDEEQKDSGEEDAEEAYEEDQEQDEEPNQQDVPSEIDETEFVSKGGLEPASDTDSEHDEEHSLDDEDEEKTSIEPVAQSSNELREARLFQRIRDYEDIVLGDKPWQLKGEVQSSHRPQNSLLEEILEFDSTTRPAAAITEEDNRSIEDIIKQRIRDKAWDDVVRTVRPMTTPQEYRKQLVLDQEKSKQSLAQIYEQQYQRELEKIDPNHGDVDGSSAPEPKEHQEIRRAMSSLFLKLDALSNFHFTPKPVAPEIKIVTNTPAVHMEEVAPVAVSDAKLLAPEEVFRGPKHAPLGKTERTSTDKNRERRKKKQKQRAINSALEARDLQRAKEGKAPTKREADAKLLKTITKSRNVQKITSSNDQGALKSSKAFFNKLQDTTTISSLSSAGKKRPKKDISKANAKKLKL